jgi:hypothetical protein
MSFKPTGLLDWILLGYGGVVLLVAIVVTPLVIGLGDDSAGSSPLTVVRFRGGLSFGGGARWLGKRQWRSRVRRRMSGFSSSSPVIRTSDPCKEAIERMISCTKDDKVRKALSDGKERFASQCRARRKDVRKAERCVKRSSCEAFERCLSGG